MTHETESTMEETTFMQATKPAGQPGQKGLSTQTIRWAGILLVGTVWISAALFGLYILAYYAAALLNGHLEKWNGVLPGLYQKGTPAATAGIGIHFATGGIVLVLGSIQLVSTIRVKYPAFHRWVGRIYVAASLLAAVGGLVFIILKGTVGGTIMDIGFSLYGVLMLVTAVQTIRFARKSKMEQHRAWAFRLYALAIGSWLYRMDYGFWLLLTDGFAHTPEFSGAFDKLMSFFFYLPNLAVAEVFIRATRFRTSPFINFLTATVLLLLTGFLVLGTYYFTKMLWGPAIIEWIF